MRVRGGLRRIRGASAIEYGVVLVLVAMSIIIGYRAFGKRVRCAMATAGNKLADSDAPDECAPPTAVAQNTGGSGEGCQGAACLLPGNCFVAGTVVLTDEGEQPIETVTVGERVLARDEAGALAWEPVVRTFARATDALVRLSLAGGDTIELTPEHRLFVAGRGWTEARALAAGDLLVDAGNVEVVVVAVESLAQPAPVFNLEVAELHSYFVGERQIWAHNDCGSGGDNSGSGSGGDNSGNGSGGEGSGTSAPATTTTGAGGLAPPSIAPPSIAPPSVTTESGGPGILSPPPPAAPTGSPAIVPPPSIITPSSAAPPTVTHGDPTVAPAAPSSTSASAALSNVPTGHLTLYADIEATGMLGGNVPTVQDMQQGAVGHAFIGFNDGSGNERPIGMWPDIFNGQFYDPSRPWASVGGLVMEPDTDHLGSNNLRHQRYPLTPAQIAAVNAYIDSHKNPQSPYNLFGWRGGQNCVTFACGAVSAAGYRPPPHSIFGFPNPNALHNNLPPRTPRPPSRRGSGSSSHSSGSSYSQGSIN